MVLECKEHLTWVLENQSVATWSAEGFLEKLSCLRMHAAVSEPDVGKTLSS